MNSNNNEHVVSIPLNVFQPNYAPEAPKNAKGFSTPPRPTRNVFGKVGHLPNYPPNRNPTLRTKRIVQNFGKMASSKKTTKSRKARKTRKNNRKSM